LGAVISGRYDDYIREFALKAKAWGHPFFLRFNWEMNGFWFPWGEGINGNAPGQFVAAWRHVHDIFTAVGATNATWVWCPEVDLHNKLTPLAELYPGDEYVDWTGLDGFNWGKRAGSPGWQTFNQVFHRTYREIVTAIAPSKPMMLPEVASSNKGGNKPAWIKDMLAKVRHRYRKIRAIVWYDVIDRGTGWPIENRPQDGNAFRTGIAPYAYHPNWYGEIEGGPIPPPAG
ncbi:MAG TPA: glycosyl hydrolase, partial [Solirubrobacterales bacterium]